MLSEYSWCVRVVQFALRHILEPMAWAVLPFEKQAPSLTVPVTFVYGENDWMDPEAGRRICKDLTALHKYKNGTAPKLRPKQNECVILEDCDHHAYMEDPEEFDKIVLEIALV